MKNVVFTGGSSLLAQSWIRNETPDHSFILGIHNRKLDQKKWKTAIFDYEDESKLYSQLKSLNVDILINCIGLTNVENCEKNKEKAFQSNAIIAKNISKVCKELSIKMVHISTDHLFEGKKAFAEENLPKAPLNIYAESKGQGEDFILDKNPDAIIIRTNFFGWGPNYKSSFSDKILKSLANSETINLFCDVFFTPVSVDILRKNIYMLLRKNAKGIYNVCSNERITKYQFGLILAKEFGYSSKLINPVSIDEIPNLTLRPKDMSLSNHKICAYLGTTMPSIEKQIHKLKMEKEYPKERHLIPYGRQDVNEKDIAKVVNVLRSDYVTQGPVIEKFERRVASYCGTEFAYSCNSATSALHIACLALGVKKGDLVWTSPISFVASSNCALYCDAEVDFVDIDPSTYNMSTSSLEKKLIEAKKNNNLPKVIIPVHLAGQSCEMDKIHELSKKYNFKIIEDASHAIGAKYKGKPVGNCSFSDISVFSFHPVKIITTCEGGMCLTNNKELGNLISRYRSHGITRQPSEMTKTPDGSWYYEQLNLGLNYRMNDVQAALGLSQMDRLEEFINKRRDIANRYNEILENSMVEIPNQHPDTLSSYHLYIIRLRKNKKITHKQLFEKFRSAGVLVNIHYIPIYRQPYYKALGFNKEGYEESEKYYKEAISIPIFPGLTFKEQKKVVDLIEEPVGFQNLF